jgi:hypothetical protein
MPNYSRSSLSRQSAILPVPGPFAAVSGHPTIDPQFKREIEERSATLGSNLNLPESGTVQVRREISQKKLIANRRNARRSTGPRTREGKRTVSRNALKHGVLSDQIEVLPGETSDRFESLCLKLRNGIGPKNAKQEPRVHNTALLIWKLGRCTRIQDSLLATGQDVRWRAMLRYWGSLSRQLREVICNL